MINEHPADEQPPFEDQLINDDPMTIQFSKILFKGRASELPDLIWLMLQEAALLLTRPHEDEVMLMLLLDLRKARMEYRKACPMAGKPIHVLSHLLDDALSHKFGRLFDH